jgi:hypothetical protein
VEGGEDGDHVVDAGIGVDDQLLGHPLTLQ